MMHCDTFRQNLDPFLDGEADAATAGEFRHHAAACEACQAVVDRRQELRAALRTLPVAPADPGFLDSIVAETLVSIHRNERRFWTSAGVGGAVAAGVVAWLILALPAELAPVPTQAPLETVAISLNVEKTFRVTFDSARELPSASISLQLPAGVGVVGYEGRESVTWTTTITPGTNILELPIVVRSGNGGIVQARLEHEGKAKTFEFAVEVI